MKPTGDSLRNLSKEREAATLNDRATIEQVHAHEFRTNLATGL